MEGTASFVLMRKLNELKGRLKNWNKKVFGSLDVNKNEALQRLITRIQWRMLEV